MNDHKESEPEIIADDEILEIDPVRDQVEQVLSPDEMEAKKRSISVKQWQDLLHVAEVAGQTKEWIDEIFTFNGLGKIIVGTQLNLWCCTSLTRLPEGLEVWWGYLNITGCTSLTRLPEGLEARLLILSDDLQGQVKQDAERLRQASKIKEILCK